MNCEVYLVRVRVRVSLVDLQAVDGLRGVPVVSKEQ